MLKRMQRAFLPFMNKRKFTHEDEIYICLTLVTATAFALLMHVILTGFFLIQVIPLFILFNVASIVTYGIGFLCIWKKYYTAAGLLLSIEVIIYTLLSNFFLGSGSNVVFYLFVVLLMQLAIPYCKLSVRIVVIVITWLALLAVLLMDDYHSPTITLDNVSFLKFFNVHVAFLGAIAELSIGNILKRVTTYSKEKRMEAFKSQAHTDALTGLYNRRYAEILFDIISVDHLPRQWCVAMLDIDDFKNINDQYGHPVGDMVLQKLSGKIKSNLRKTDILFRWGGEEFLILLEGISLQSAYPILEKVRASVEDMKLPVKEDTIGVTITIGVATLDLKNIKQSIIQCDNKLYQGKNSGKNKVVI